MVHHMAVRAISAFTMTVKEIKAKAKADLAAAVAAEKAAKAAMAPKADAPAVKISRSVARATTSREVYQAICAQYLAKNAIATIGTSASGCRVTQVGNGGAGFARAAGRTVYQCRTNKWLAAALPEIKAFGKTIGTLTLKQAQEQAYAIRDKYTCSVSIWSDQRGKNSYLSGQPFTAFVNEGRPFETKDGVQGIEYPLTNLIIEEIVVVNTTADENDLLLDDQLPVGNKEKAAIVSAQI